MNIAITGGSGFIGFNVAKNLQSEHDISIIDNKKGDLDNVQYYESDINDIDSLIQATKNVDIVIHLAAALGVVNTEQNPVMTLDTNILGTKSILEACKINKIKKIIISSSSEVYGEPLKIPISETDKVIPITNYGISKLAAEEYVKAYSKNFSINYTIFRLFNVYGPKQGDSWVIPEFIKKALNDETIFIHGNGSQIRAFCHVNDISKAFSLCLDQGNNEIFNIGNNLEPISIKQLAKKIIELTNSKSTIKFIPFKASNRNRTEIMTRSPDIDKANQIFDYEPSISLNNGLLSTIEFFKKHN